MDATFDRIRLRRAVSRERSDAALVRAACDGARDAVHELFERHWPDAHRAAYWIAHDAAAAEDIAQEAFVAALRALDRFDQRRPFAPWLHRIVVNRAIDYTRARDKRREVGADALPEAATPQVPAADEDLLAALTALPVDQRAVVVMRHVLGASPAEIATALGLPRGTVNSRMRRGLDALRSSLDAG